MTLSFRTSDHFVLCAMVAAPFLAGAGALVGGPPGPGRPVLVIAPPWNGGAGGVLARAGGWAIGPSKTVVAVIGQGDRHGFVAGLYDAGAWLVRDAATLAALCAGPVE